MPFKPYTPIRHALLAMLLLSACGTESKRESAPAGATAQSMAVDTNTAALTVASVGDELTECREEESFPSPTKLQACDQEAVKAAGRIVDKSPASRELDRFLSDLFEPLARAVGGGEDALAARVVVTNGYADFALRRARILTSPSAVEMESMNRLDSLLQANFGDTTPSLKLRWHEIRKADCGAYRVPRCEEQLDTALADMLARITAQE